MSNAKVISAVMKLEVIVISRVKVIRLPVVFQFLKLIHMFNVIQKVVITLKDIDLLKVIITAKVIQLRICINRFVTIIISQIRHTFIVIHVFTVIKIFKVIPVLCKVMTS